MENKIDNQNRVKEQYKNADNLNARINLQSYNTNKEDWNEWFFRKMDIPEYSKVLELGCGNGLLWNKNKDSINTTWDISLSDFSEGMLECAKQNLNNKKIKYQVVDIQDMPYEDESFDVIIARHMLYHVPDIDKALSEVKRVLKPDGRFYVSTNGKEHMKELKEMVEAYDKNIRCNPQKLAEKFGIENGGEILSKYFSCVSVEEFNGQIIVDKVDPVVSYVISCSRDNLTDENSLEGFRRYLEAEINENGAIRITTKGGMFTVSNSKTTEGIRQNKYDKVN